jgi:hypothetical protein
MSEQKATLSVVASTVRRISRGHAEAAELDAGFDGGEFSRPEHGRMEREQVAAALAAAGWTAVEFLAEVEARTSPKWVFFNSGLQTADRLAWDQEQESYGY